ncbi:MAG: hypothetical protein AAB520_02425, partial [Patescibacteria group bacterium]
IVMSWCFAIVNNRLAEIYFEKNKNGIKFLGHCYVKESEYTLKEEKEWIKKDIEKVKLIYRKGKYRNKLAN